MTHIIITSIKKICDACRSSKAFGILSRKKAVYGELYANDYAHVFYLPFQNTHSYAAYIGYISATHTVQTISFINQSTVIGTYACFAISDGTQSFYPDMLYHDIPQCTITDPFLFSACTAAACFHPPHRIFCFLLSDSPSKNDIENISTTLAQSDSSTPLDAIEDWVHSLPFSFTIQHLLKKKILAHYSRHHTLPFQHWEKIINLHHSHTLLIQALEL